MPRRPPAGTTKSPPPRARPVHPPSLGQPEILPPRPASRAMPGPVTTLQNSAAPYWQLPRRAGRPGPAQAPPRHPRVPAPRRDGRKPECRSATRSSRRAPAAFRARGASRQRFPWLAFDPLPHLFPAGKVQSWGQPAGRHRPVYLLAANWRWPEHQRASVAGCRSRAAAANGNVQNMAPEPLELSGPRRRHFLTQRHLDQAA